MAARIPTHAAACFAALALAAIFCPATAAAQDCDPADIVLGSQAEVDTFQADHGPCTRVAGELKVKGGDIANLQGLAGLDAISDLRITGNAGLLSLEGLEPLTQVGYLAISGNAALRNLTGLSGLERVGGNEFRISNNRSLESLDGLEALHTVVGDLVIEDNDLLQDIDGLSALVTVTIEPVYKIEIQRNAALADLDGLVSLTEIQGSLIIHLNDSLSDIGGLSNLAEVGAMLHIAANPVLTNLDGLAALNSVGSLGLVNNDRLTDLGGLSRLETVRSWFEISWNPVLSGLDGLAALTRVGLSDPSMGALIIRYNAGLQNLDGLSALQAVQSLALEYNPALEDCGWIVELVDPFDDHEPGPGPGRSGIPDIGDQARVRYNAAGCNSVNDILARVPLLEMNPGLNDAWFDPATAGQGFVVIVFPDLRELFLAWFTYDTERPPPDVAAVLGEPGHRWLTAQGEYEGSTATLTIHIAEGGVFDTAVPAPKLRQDGEILLEFSTCNAGTVTYDIPSIGRQGVVPIERPALDNVALCYTLDRLAAAADPQ